MLTRVRELVRSEEGQGMVEYGLILGLIAVAAVAALLLLGPKVADMFNNAKDALPTYSTTSA